MSCSGARFPVLALQAAVRQRPEHQTLPHSGGLRARRSAPQAVAVLRIAEDPFLGLGFRMGFGRRPLSLAPCLDATACATVDRFGPRPPHLPAHRASHQPAPERPHAHIHAQPILAGVSRRTEPQRAGIAMLPHGAPALAPSVTLPALDHLQAAARPSPRPPPDLGPLAEAVDGPLLPLRTVTVTATVFPIVYLISAAITTTNHHHHAPSSGYGRARRWSRAVAALDTLSSGRAGHHANR